MSKNGFGVYMVLLVVGANSAAIVSILKSVRLLIRWEAVYNHQHEGETRLHRRGTLMKESILQRRIDEVNLSVRASNQLKCFGVSCVQDLLQVTDKELANSPSIGTKTMREVSRFRRKMNLALGTCVNSSSAVGQQDRPDKRTIELPPPNSPRETASGERQAITGGDCERVVRDILEGNDEPE